MGSPALSRLRQHRVKTRRSGRERYMGNDGKRSQLFARDKSSLRALDRELPPIELKPQTGYELVETDGFRLRGGCNRLLCRRKRDRSAVNTRPLPGIYQCLVYGVRYRQAAGEDKSE